MIYFLFFVFTTAGRPLWPAKAAHQKKAPCTPLALINLSRLVSKNNLQVIFPAEINSSGALAKWRTFWWPGIRVLSSESALIFWPSEVIKNKGAGRTRTDESRFCRPLP